MEASLGIHNHISFPEVVIIININIIAFILCPTSLLPETQIILVLLKARLPGEAKAKLLLIPGGPQGWLSVLCKVIGGGSQSFHTQKKSPVHWISPSRNAWICVLNP